VTMFIQIAKIPCKSTTSNDRHSFSRTGREDSPIRDRNGQQTRPEFDVVWVGMWCIQRSDMGVGEAKLQSGRSPHCAITGMSAVSCCLFTWMNRRTDYFNLWFCKPRKSWAAKSFSRTQLEDLCMQIKCCTRTMVQCRLERTCICTRTEGVRDCQRSLAG
jgi:hypothetical protein